VRLVVVRTIVIIVPFIVPFLIFTLLISASIFNSAACISVADDIVYVAVVSVASSAMLLQWSDAAGRLQMRTLPVVIIMTPVSVLLVIDRNRYGCHVQHHLESLDMHVDLFIIFGEMG
jgi:hypothetical protein